MQLILLTLFGLCSRCRRLVFELSRAGATLCIIESMNSVRFKWRNLPGTGATVSRRKLAGWGLEGLGVRRVGKSEA